jgi:hypothetical protein
MQPFFFVRYSAALCAYELRIADDITVFTQLFYYIFRLPFAERFCFLCHFVTPYGSNTFASASTGIESFLILD